MAKTIVLLLDGTWNDSAFDNADTNIVRLRELIARNLSNSPKALASSNSSNTPSSSSSSAFSQTLVFYERGVGTGAFLNRWTGGAFGQGLTIGIRRAYRYLSFHYEPGDAIFVFGFSRGAYTARSLVGYLQSAGLLLREHCTDDLEHTAWDYYRCAPADRLAGIWTGLSGKVHSRDELRIDCLGVFDTVGALGVPLAPFKVSNRDRYEFHDVDLSSIVRVNLHALALDEHRVPFEASVWRRSKFKRFNSDTEQVWFSGAHSDVGGGNIDEELRARTMAPGLDDVSLDWMIRRILHHYKNFPISLNDSPIPSNDRLEVESNDQDRWATTPQYNSRKNVYRLMPKAIRSIANTPVNCGNYASFGLGFGFGEVNVSRHRHANSLGEKVHISTLMRLGRTIEVDGNKKKYLPKNLMAILDNIESFYNIGPVVDRVSIEVVDWNGDVIQLNSPAASALLIALRQARQRLSQ